MKENVSFKVYKFRKYIYNSLRVHSLWPGDACIWQHVSCRHCQVNNWSSSCISRGPVKIVGGSAENFHIIMMFYILGCKNPFL